MTDRIETIAEGVCAVCKGSGWTGHYKPMSDGHGGTQLVFVPRLCGCPAADDAANRYEENLKAGRAGRDDSSTEG